MRGARAAADECVAPALLDQQAERMPSRIGKHVKGSHSSCERSYSRRAPNSRHARDAAPGPRGGDLEVHAHLHRDILGRPGRWGAPAWPGPSPLDSRCRRAGPASPRRQGGRRSAADRPAGNADRGARGRTRPELGSPVRRWRAGEPPHAPSTWRDGYARAGLSRSWPATPVPSRAPCRRWSGTTWRLGTDPWFLCISTSARGSDAPASRDSHDDSRQAVLTHVRLS